MKLALFFIYYPQRKLLRFLTIPLFRIHKKIGIPLPNPLVGLLASLATQPSPKGGKIVNGKNFIGENEVCSQTLEKKGKLGIPPYY